MGDQKLNILQIIIPRNKNLLGLDQKEIQNKLPQLKYLLFEMIVLDKKKFRTNSYLEKDNYRKMKFMKEKSKRE